jgi:hypothetical protein
VVLLRRVRVAWEDAQSSRDRSAIYRYLTAVYGLVAWWAAEGRDLDRARRALRLQRLEVSDREEPFAAIIRCTADPAKADKRTRSKWSRVLRYAAAYKPDSEPLDRFIQRKGASTRALPGSLGAWGEVRQRGPRDVRQACDESIISTKLSGAWEIPPCSSQVPVSSVGRRFLHRSFWARRSGGRPHSYYCSSLRLIFLVVICLISL